MDGRVDVDELLNSLSDVRNKKSCPFLQRWDTMKIGQDFLDVSWTVRSVVDPGSCFAHCKNNKKKSQKSYFLVIPSTVKHALFLIQRCKLPTLVREAAKKMFFLLARLLRPYSPEFF